MILDWVKMLKSDLWVPTSKAHAARVTACIRSHSSDLSLLLCRQNPGQQDVGASGTNTLAKRALRGYFFRKRRARHLAPLCISKVVQQCSCLGASARARLPRLKGGRTGCAALANTFI